MRKSVIALIAVVVLAGAAVAAVPVIERHAAASIKSEIERNGTAKVDEVSVGLFARRVTLLNLKSKTAMISIALGSSPAARQTGTVSARIPFSISASRMRLSR